MSEIQNKLLSPKYVIVATLALFTVGFHIYLIFTGLMPNLVSRPIHLALVLPWVFLLTLDENISKLTKYIGYILLVCAMFSS